MEWTNWPHSAEVLPTVSTSLLSEVGQHESTGEVELIRAAKLALAMTNVSKWESI